MNVNHCHYEVSFRKGVRVTGHMQSIWHAPSILGQWFGFTVELILVKQSKYDPDNEHFQRGRGCIGRGEEP